VEKVIKDKFSSQPKSHGTTYAHKGDNDNEYEDSPETDPDKDDGSRKELDFS
jgi:hypothetical protein